MCFIACTLWPPHSPPACSSSPFAVRNACSARSTSAGLSFWNGLENRVADGLSIITENSNRVAIFIFSPYTNRDSVNSAGLTDGSRRATEVWFHGNFPFLKQPLRYVAAVSVALTPATKLS